MEDLYTLFEIVGVVVAGLGLLATLVWAVSRGVDVVAVLVGGVLLAIGVDELTGDTARDRWTVARVAAGAGVIALGIAAHRQASRPTVRRMLTALAVMGVFSGCAGLTGAHARRAYVLALGSAGYLSVGMTASASAVAFAFIFIVQALSGHVVPADRVATVVFAAAILALAVGAFRWPSRVRPLAGGILAAAILWGLIDGHWWSAMAPAQDAAATFAGFLWVGGRRADRGTGREAPPDPQ
jgi:hypothetical protein